MKLGRSAIVTGPCSRRRGGVDILGLMTLLLECASDQYHLAECYDGKSAVCTIEENWEDNLSRRFLVFRYGLLRADIELGWCWFRK